MNQKKATAKVEANKMAFQETAMSQPLVLKEYQAAGWLWVALGRLVPHSKPVYRSKISPKSL